MATTTVDIVVYGGGFAGVAAAAKAAANTASNKTIALIVPDPVDPVSYTHLDVYKRQTPRRTSTSTPGP